MDDIFGYMNGRYEVSLADSTMMWIVHCAMNKAQEKMKEKKGPLERLNEISKFYELAVMQLEGCLSIVHEAESESGCCILESNHEEVLEDLREIKDRLQGRLEESESAILEKDRELTQRLKNELQLRQALEVKEKELVSLNNEEGGLCELRTSMDQQMLNIKQRLEPQHHQHIIGSSDNDTKKIEEMGCDIDILKHTMDLAFGKMQSAIFMGEIGPKERQWKLVIEKDIMSIFITSFMKEFQKNIENHVHKCWQEHWSQLMNEVTSVTNELSILQETCPEDSDSSSLSSPTKPSPTEEVELPEEEEENENEKGGGGGSNYVSKLIKNHESIIRQKNEELNRIKHRISQEKKASSSKKRQELNSLKEIIHSVTERLDNLITSSAKPCKSLFNEKATSQVYEIDRVVKNVDTLESNVGNKAEEEEIRVLTMKKEHNRMQNLISEDKYDLVEELENLIQEHVYTCCLREVINEWNESIERNAVEGKIREEINLIVFSEAVKDNKYNQESVLVKCQCGEVDDDRLQCSTSTSSDQVYDEIERNIKEDVSMLIFRKSVEEFNKIMVGCKAENTITKEIDEIVFAETLTTSSASIVDQVEGEKNLSITFLESLLSCFEQEENLMLSARSEIKEHSKQLDFGSERGDLHDHEINEDLLTGEEQTFSSLTTKVENVLQQLGISKALLKQLGTRLGHSLRGDSECFHNKMFEEQLRFLSSFEFEATVSKKFETVTTRYSTVVYSIYD